MLSLETHQEVFTWALKLIAKQGLVSGKTAGIDAKTLEANATMKSIVRCDTGKSYKQFRTSLANASAIETPTLQDLIKFDKKRKNKASNDDWLNPFDPEANIAKMKAGSTHLAHKVEHAVDMETGAVLGMTLQGADLGDTTTIMETINVATANLAVVATTRARRTRSTPTRSWPKRWLTRAITPTYADALYWMRHARPFEALASLIVNPERPNRTEPRCKKRRPKQCELMNKPRNKLRKSLARQWKTT